MNFKKIVIEIVSIVFAVFALLCSATGAMEYLQEKSYFGLGETTSFVLVVLFSLFVLAFCYKGLKDILYASTDKDKKE